MAKKAEIFDYYPEGLTSRQAGELAGEHQNRKLSKKRRDRALWLLTLDANARAVRDPRHIHQRAAEVADHARMLQRLKGEMAYWREHEGYGAAEQYLRDSLVAILGYKSAAVAPATEVMLDSLSTDEYHPFHIGFMTAYGGMQRGEQPPPPGQFDYGLSNDAWKPRAAAAAAERRERQAALGPDYATDTSLPMLDADNPGLQGDNPGLFDVAALKARYDKAQADAAARRLGQQDLLPPPPEPPPPRKPRPRGRSPAGGQGGGSLPSFTLQR